MFFVIVRICMLMLMGAAFAAGTPSALPLLRSVEGATLQNQAQTQRASLNGWLENNGGRLRLVVSNNSPGEFRGTAKISLGGSEEQKEIGFVLLTLPGQEISLLQITGATLSGDHYALAIYDQRGVRLFFRIAPLRSTSDPTPAMPIALMPVQQSAAKSAANSSTGNSAPIPATANPAEFAKVATGIQVKARVLAGNESNESFILSFELRAQRPISYATLSISAAKLKEQKPVSINLHSQVDFKLPDSLESNTINYTITSKEGTLLAKGELDLNVLMAEDSVTVKDIRLDRQSYQPGETVRLTVVTEGSARAGYRLEVSVRDAQSQTIFSDQKVIGADETANSFDFLITLPGKLSAPAIFEFRILDAETGLMFDSGEREISIVAGKSSSQ